MLSLFPVLIDCDCVETVLFELMITSTWRWLAYFVILFLYTRLLSFPQLLSTGLLLLLSKIYMQFCVSRKRMALTQSLIFWRFKNLDFLYFAVSVSCFNRLRLWWNCAFWIDHNMHWALIALFCDTLCVYKTLESSAVALNWLATTAFEKLYVSVSCFNRLRLWWNCAFWIDDNMHWALIALFCDTLCVYKPLESSAVALNWLATTAFEKLYAILFLNETLGFDWVFDFLEI